MDLEVLLVADYANIAEGGKLNIMGIFSAIYASTFPARHSEMQLIAKFSASPAECDATQKITVKLLSEDATQELVSWSQNVTIPKVSGGRRVEINQILKLRDIVFLRPGTYRFYVFIDLDEKGSLPIYVIQGTLPGA